MAVDVQDFQRDVLDRSHDRPVVVDFWAAWCGPCRILGPVLERLAEQAQGGWILAKVDTEIFPHIAEQYGVRGIPNVKLFLEGKPVAEFTGALPEASIRQWLEKHLPGKFVRELEHAEALFVSGNEQGARATVDDVLAKDPGNLRARILAAQLLLFSDPDRATTLLEDLEEHVENFEKIDSVRTLAAILSKASNPDGLPEGTARVLYASALQAAARRDFDAALAAFIEVIRTDRHYDHDGSRKACIAIFKYLGEGHELTLKHRRDFSGALY